MIIGDIIDIAKSGGLMLVYVKGLNGYAIYGECGVLSELVYKNGKSLLGEDQLRALVKSFRKSQLMELK